jgi:hypothetical protein
VSRTSALWDDYQAWCADLDLESLTKGRFMAALRKAGHVTVQGMSSHRVGLALRPVPNPDEDHQDVLRALTRGGLYPGWDFSAFAGPSGWVQPEQSEFSKWLETCSGEDFHRAIDQLEARTVPESYARKAGWL